jgi:HEAT repeat protein
MKQVLLPNLSQCLHRAPLYSLLVALLCAAFWQPAPARQGTAQQTPAAKPTPRAASAAGKAATKPPAPPPAAQIPGQMETVANAWKRITEATSSGRVRKRAAALQTLASAGDRPEVMAVLDHAMDDSHAELRKAAAFAFGQMRAREAIPRLRQALDDTAPGVRVAAARSLWQMKDYSGSDLLIRIVERRAPAEEAKLKQEWHQALRRVDNPSAVLLLALEQGIGFLPGPSFLAIPLFREVIMDKSAPGRATAATLLAEQHTDAVVSALEQALVDPEGVVRAAAALALGKSGRPEEIIHLSPLLHDRKVTVRLAAAVAIVRLSPPGSGPMPAGAPRP